MEKSMNFILDYSTSAQNEICKKLSSPDFSSNRKEENIDDGEKNYDIDEDFKNMRYILREDRKFKEMNTDLGEFLKSEQEEFFPIGSSKKISFVKGSLLKNIQDIVENKESKGITQVEANNFLMNYEEEDNAKDIMNIPLKKSDEKLGQEISSFDVDPENIFHNDGFDTFGGFPIYGSLQPLENEDYNKVDSDAYFKYASKQLEIIRKSSSLNFKSLGKNQISQ